MITTIELADMSITMCVVRTLKFCSLSKFQEYETVLLTIIVILYIRFPEHTHLRSASLPP